VKDSEQGADGDSVTSNGVLCGCGKQGRYTRIDEDGNETWACNKYQRCKSYEELRTIARNLEIEARVYRHHLEKIVSVNAMDYEYKAWAKEALDACDKAT